MTLFYFVALIAVSYAMDKIGERNMAKLKEAEEERTGVSKPTDDTMPVTVQTSYSPAMFYNLLIPIEAGKCDEDQLDPKDKQRIDRMRGFLKANFNTDKVQDIEFADLKQKIQGESVISRLKYRSKGASDKRKKKVGKNEIYRKESQHARLLS